MRWSKSNPKFGGSNPKRGVQSYSNPKFGGPIQKEGSNPIPIQNLGGPIQKEGPILFQSKIWGSNQKKGDGSNPNLGIQSKKRGPILKF